MNKYNKICIVAIVFTCLASAAQAATVGNWSDSKRSWNHGDFADINATMTGGGHTVAADASMTAANLANYDLFVIGEAVSTPVGGDISDLSDWVQGGGCLIINTNSSASGVADGNSILSGIGSSISFSEGGGPAAAPLVGGTFFVDGPPYALAGQNIPISPGNVVNGGMTVAGDFLHIEQLGSGWVFAMGDRWEHNFSSPSNSNPTGQIFLNAGENCGEGAPPPVPVPMLGNLAIFIMILAFMLLGAQVVRRNRYGATRK